MNEQGKKALIKVAEWLEAGAPHVVIKEGQTIAEFDMNYGGEPLEDGCGTACCIAGALVQFEGLMEPDPDTGSIEFFSEDEDEYDGLEGERELGAGEVAQNFLDITEDDADKLFMPFNNFEYGASYEFSIPERAAAVVRHFIETGKVEWDKFDLSGSKIV